MASPAIARELFLRGRAALDRTGHGKDTILGDSSQNTCNFLACRISFGNDVINARDGSRDVVECASGADRVTVDRRDRVRGCEQVSRR